MWLPRCSEVTWKDYHCGYRSTGALAMPGVTQISRETGRGSVIGSTKGCWNGYLREASVAGGRIATPHFTSSCTQTRYIMPSPLGTQLLTGDTLMTMNGCTMSFMRLPSGGNPAAEEWSVDLPFDDWSAALHPPTNVVVVSEHTGSTSYVPSEHFLNPSHVTLMNSTHTQERAGSYSENGHWRTAPLRQQIGFETRPSRQIYENSSP